MTTASDREKKESCQLGAGCRVLRPCLVGFVWRPGALPLRVGQRALIRTFSVIYADVTIGDDFQSGHGSLVRQFCQLGDRVVVGSNAIIENNVTIGDDVKIESGVCIASHSVVGNRVFIGPGVAFTNDRYPQRLRREYQPAGPRIADDVSIGANATILPGIHVGRGSIIAAGCLVTSNVPEWSLVKGIPGRSESLPARLKHRNEAATHRRLQGE